MNTNANEVPKNINQAIIKNPFDGKTYDLFEFFKFLDYNGFNEVNDLASYQIESIEFVAANLDYEEKSNQEIQNIMAQMFIVNNAIKKIEPKSKIIE